MKLILIVAFAFVCSMALAQTEQPQYKKAISRFQRYYNNNQPDSLFSMFNTAVKEGLPLDKTKMLFSQMQAQVGPLQQTTYLKQVSSAAVYKADFKNATMLINLSLNSLNQVDGFYFNEYKADKPAGTIAKTDEMAPMDASVTEEPVLLKTLAGKISGTITIPKKVTGKMPVVLIIAGSGPTDRNGNALQLNLNTNTYRLIANELGKAGIASLRYDKRGIGQSTTSAKEVDTRFTDFVDDASALISMLKDDARFSKVVVLGHSEGSLVGMLACIGEPLGGFISAAGAGQSADLILTEQMKSQPPSVSLEFKAIVDSLRKGKVVPKVDPALYALIRPSIQPYMMSWMRYDPQKVIKRLKLPILIVQGTTDIQVTVDDAEKLKKAKSEAQLKIIEGMSHLLKAGSADRQLNSATYSDPALPLKPEFVAAVVEFIGKLK